MKTVRYQLFFVIVACLTGLVSCDLNKIQFDDNDSSNVQNESVASSYFDDAADLSTTALSQADTATAQPTVSDNRFSCAVVTKMRDASSTLLHPKGSFTMDFGVSCADGRGNTRSGKVKMAYSGYRFRPKSAISITFDDYTINGVKMEGTYTITNADESTEDLPILLITIDGGKLTWPDGTFASRDGAFKRKWLRDNTNTSVWHVSGGAYGYNRNGKQYTMEITSNLVFKQICQLTHKKLLPATGVETLTIGNTKQMTIDFGNGSCDQQVTITVNSKSTAIDLSKTE